QGLPVAAKDDPRDEAALERLLGDESGERAEPGAGVLREQLSLAGRHRLPPRVALRQPGPRQLGADELGPFAVAVLLVPVGAGQPRQIVGGVLPDAVDDALGGRHSTSLVGTAYRASSSKPHFAPPVK